MPTVEIAIDSRKAKQGAAEATRALDQVGRQAEDTGRKVDRMVGDRNRGVRAATEEFRGFGKAAAGVSGVLGASASVTQFSREIGNLGTNLNSGTNAAFAFSRALLEVSRVKEDFGELAQSVGKTNGVMGTLIGLVKANPFLLLATAISAVVPLFGLFASGSDEATEAIERQKKATQDLRNEFDKLQQSAAFRQFAGAAGLQVAAPTREGILTALAERQAAIQTQGAALDPKVLVQYLEQKLQSVGIAQRVSAETLYRRQLVPSVPGTGMYQEYRPPTERLVPLQGEAAQQAQIALISSVVDLINRAELDVPMQLIRRAGPMYGPEVPRSQEEVDISRLPQPTIPERVRELYGPAMPGADYFGADRFQPSPYQQQLGPPLPYAPDPARGVGGMWQGVFAQFQQAGSQALGMLAQMREDIIDGEQRRYDEQLAQYERMSALSQQFVGTLTSGLEAAIFEGQKFGAVMRAVFVDISRQAFRAGIGQVFQGVNFFGSAPTPPATTG